jgi:hypothetical protein
MLLKKAIKIAQKSKFGDANADHETLTDILETVGRTLEIVLLGLAPLRCM